MVKLCNNNEKRLKQGMFWRRVGSAVILAGTAVMLFAPVKSLAAKKPDISKNSLNMIVGKQEKLAVYNKKGCTVSWKSSKKSVATVSRTGKVKAKKKGSAKITAVVKTNQGGKRCRLVCKISVNKTKLQIIPAEKQADQGNITVPAENTSDRLPGKSISEQNVPGQSGENGIVSEQSVTDQKIMVQPEKNEPIPDEPANPTTGGVVLDEQAELLFGNYNDGMWNGNFFGNQQIKSYEQLQNLLVSLKEEMAGYGNGIEGYNTLRWYVNQLEEIDQDYFVDHVLYINTMCVARGYDYTLDSTKKIVSENGVKKLSLSLKRRYNLAPDQCVTCDMPYYSFFIQLPRDLVEDDCNIECSLLSDEHIVPPYDPDDLYSIQSSHF